MASAKTGLFQYIKAAFNARVPVKGLGHVPVNWLALLGMAVATATVGWPVLLVGGGLELGYLMSLAHNQRFRRVVDGQMLMADHRQWQKRQLGLVEQLQPEQRQRYGRLLARCEELQRLANPSDPAAGLRLESIARLQWIFLRLLASKEVLAARSNQTAIDKVVLELRSHERRLVQPEVTASESLLRSIQSTIEILKRRLANLQEAQGKVHFIHAELDRIEQQVELIIEETALSQDSSHLATRVDSVTQTLSEAQDWMRANAELLGEVAADLQAPPAQPVTRVEG